MTHLPTNFPPLSRRYTAVHDSGLRRLSAIRNVCIHCTESETAVSSAAWFANAKSRGSTHLVIGDYAGFRTLPDNVIPWAAPPLNSVGVHIEIVGYSEFTHAEWLKHTRRIQWAALQTATACLKYSIPIIWCNANNLRLKLKGITAHYEVSDAFHLTDHIDPGPHFPYNLFMQWVHEYVKVYHGQVAKIV